MRKVYPALSTFLLSSMVLVALLFSVPSLATNYPFSATYSGAQEVPPVVSTGTGTIHGVYNDFTNTIYYAISFSALSANTTAAHFHAPGATGVGAPVIIAHAGFPIGDTAGVYFKSDVLTDAQEVMLFAGQIYSNIHTSANTTGEIRAQIILGPASPDVYSILNTYSGAQEVPPNPSTGTGTISGAYNSLNNTFYYTITFSGLDSGTTAAHF
ncbi:MAG TPA: CHRD domain-containing protein, partial [Chitinophagaceae bacterium]|nr:CHRD domain-containing protein [Chitinophagaceae bacterium]